MHGHLEPKSMHRWAPMGATCRISTKAQNAAIFQSTAARGRNFVLLSGFIADATAISETALLRYVCSALTMMRFQSEPGYVHPLLRRSNMFVRRFIPGVILGVILTTWLSSNRPRSSVVRRKSSPCSGCTF